MSSFAARGDTIAAIATAVAPQQGSVSIVRLSGAESWAIARCLFRAPGRQAWESHRILYGTIRDPETGAAIDEALLLLMRSPRSYTREDVAEFQCHGGIVIVRQILQLCVRCGARLAQPGEFTLRAFLNGRLDLTQAESVADLVGARSPLAARSALAGLQGKLAAPVRHLRDLCLDLLAEIEARVDFEEDLPPLDEEEVADRLREVAATVDEILATADRGELIRSGLKIAIVGRPNVGKSSLLNAWSRSDRAIVTDLPGTTRDTIESQLSVRGIPVRVLDTAGIRDTADAVEKIGVTRSHQAAREADLVLFVADASAGWTPEDEAIYRQVCSYLLILVANKIDLVPADPKAGRPLFDAESFPKVAIVPAAAALSQGIDALEDAILAAVEAGDLQAVETDFAINQRQATALTQAKVALQEVQKAIADRLPLDFWTIDLRAAARALGEVTGEEVTESVLDRIFSRFCIGK